jgi:hypothetical protein
MGQRLEWLPADLNGGRQVVLLDLADWSWPVDAGIEWFTSFIAADARRVSVARVAALAEQMLARRCGYVSVWGPACERFHDIFDDVFVEAERLCRGGTSP